MRQRLERRLLSLSAGELVSTLLFATLWLTYPSYVDWTVPFLTDSLAVFAFAILEFVLLQGSLYWLLKRRRIMAGGGLALTHEQIRLFSYFRRLNALLLLIGIGGALYAFWARPLTFALWYCALYLFALIEYINYYHIRLSYPWREMVKTLLSLHWRRSKLSQELELDKTKAPG